MEDWLQKIVDDDDLGLLDVKPKNARITADERLVKSFEEINKFIEENKREPELSNDILENSLYYRLEGIREDNNKINQLKGFDTFGLLKETEETPQPQSIDDILNDDDLGLLSTPKEDDIFNLGHGLKKVDRSVGGYDYVARAKKCEDFDKFEPLFKACQADLKNGKRRLMRFTTETSIKEGAFLVYRGMLLYVDKVGNFSQRREWFQVPLGVIEQAIYLFQTGEIVNYYYSREKQEVLKIKC